MTNAPCVNLSRGCFGKFVLEDAPMKHINSVFCNQENNSCLGGHLALTERKCDIISREHQVPVRPLRRAGHGWTRCSFHCALAYSHVELKDPDFTPWRMILFVLSAISPSVPPYSSRSLHRLAHSS